MCKQWVRLCGAGEHPFGGGQWQAFQFTFQCQWFYWVFDICRRHQQNQVKEACRTILELCRVKSCFLLIRSKINCWILCLWQQCLGQTIISEGSRCVRPTKWISRTMILSWLAEGRHIHWALVTWLMRCMDLWIQFWSSSIDLSILFSNLEPRDVYFFLFWTILVNAADRAILTSCAEESMFKNDMFKVT